MKIWVDLNARYKITKAFRAGAIYKTIGTGENEKKIFPKTTLLLSLTFPLNMISPFQLD